MELVDEESGEGKVENETSHADPFELEMDAELVLEEVLQLKDVHHVKFFHAHRHSKRETITS